MISGSGYLRMDKSEAEKMAHTLIREKYGNLPSIGSLAYKDGIWAISIDVKYPRILFDPAKNRPKKVRFMSLKDVGLIKIDENEGVILNKPRYYDLSYDLRDEIETRLDSIKINVQKALVKVGAARFSKLPLSEHMHSPIQDIIAYLLINDTLDLNQFFSTYSKVEQSKYLKHVDALIETGLVRRNNDILIPDNALIEIERNEDDLTSKLPNALSYFFSFGYDNIKSIQQVLGPYLLISGDIFTRSIEYGELTTVGYNELLRALQRKYGSSIKSFRLPRYLIQLITVGLIDQKMEAGENLWIPNEDLLIEVENQNEILSPVREMFIENIIKQ